MTSGFTCRDFPCIPTLGVYRDFPCIPTGWVYRENPHSREIYVSLAVPLILEATMVQLLIDHSN